MWPLLHIAISFSVFLQLCDTAKQVFHLLKSSDHGLLALKTKPDKLPFCIKYLASGILLPLHRID